MDRLPQNFLAIHINKIVMLTKYSLSGLIFGLSTGVHLNYYIKYPTFSREDMSFLDCYYVRMPHAQLTSPRHNPKFNHFNCIVSSENSEEFCETRYLFSFVLYFITRVLAGSPFGYFSCSNCWMPFYRLSDSSADT